MLDNKSKLVSSVIFRDKCFFFDNDKNAKLMKVFPIFTAFLKNKVWQKQPPEVV